MRISDWSSDVCSSDLRLSQSFSDLASKGVDLSVTSITAPQLTEPPALDQAKGMLRLKGYFPGQKVQINFEMLYQAVDGRRSEERRVGKECVRPCRSRWSPYH